MTTQAHALITVSGVQGAWAAKDGGSPQVETSVDYDGGDPNPIILIGNESYDDVTVRRRFLAGRDEGILAGLDRRKGRPVSCTVVPTNAAMASGARRTTYRGVLKKVNHPTFDRRQGNSAADMSIVIAVNEVVHG